MNYQDKIEQAKQLFLTDVDEETQKDNLEQIREWEKSLRTNTAFSNWQESDISKQLIKQFKITYKNASLQLAESRNLTDEQRKTLWATKDACLIVLDLLAKDTKNEIENVQKAIDHALSST
jgi:hypothetical protein